MFASSTDEAVFGFCAKCAPSMHKTEEWASSYSREPDGSAAYVNNDDAGTVHKLFGVVDTLRLATDEDVTRLTTETEMFSGLKSRLRDIMKQKNCKNIEPEQWQEIFDGLVQEHMVRKVHES